MTFGNVTQASSGKSSISLEIVYVVFCIQSRGGPDSDVPTGKICGPYRAA